MIDPEQYESWLESGFAWLSENWTDQEWPEVAPSFVGALGLAAAADDPVVHALVAEIAGLPAEDQRATVLDPGARAGLVHQALGADGQQGAPPAAEPAGAVPQATPAPGTSDTAAEVEPAYVDGVGWMRWDAAADSWVPMADAAAPPASDAAAPPASDAAAAPAPDAAAPPAGDTALEPAAVAGQVAQEVVLPALTEALAAMPELASIPAEELNKLMSEVLAERVAAASN